jgi:hypothetical protein
MRTPECPALTMDRSSVIPSPTPKAAKKSHLSGLFVMGQATLPQEKVKNKEQSRNVYENKQNIDILPSKMHDILVESTEIVGHFGRIDTNRRTFWTETTNIVGHFGTK